MRKEEEHQSFIEKTSSGALADYLSPFRLKLLSMENEPPGHVSTSSVRLSGRGPKVARHTDTGSEQHYIPYKSVVQARQEHVLVGAFLRRYTRGEVGAYVNLSEDGAGKEELSLVGGRLPGVYYRPVRVCSKCHMVYTLIDEARARSLRPPRARSEAADGENRQKSCTRRMSSGIVDSAGTLEGGSTESSDSEVLLHPAVGVSGAGTTTTQQRQGSADLAHGSDSQPVSLQVDGGFAHSPQVLSLAEARKAMDALSQADISELRSFCRPPAAVVYVVSAALRLLDRRKRSESDCLTTSWPNARAIISSKDFFSRLQTLDPRRVSRHQLRALEPALSSPGFRPAAVRPFSNAAGNLSLWVLGVVQANRWMTGNGHERTNVVPPAADVMGWGAARAGALGVGSEASFPSTSCFQDLASCSEPLDHPEMATRPRRRRRCSPSSPQSGGRHRGRFSRRSADMDNVDRKERGTNSDARSASDAGSSMTLSATPTTATSTTATSRGAGVRSLLAVGPATSPMRSSSGFAFGCNNSSDRHGFNVTPSWLGSPQDISAPIGVASTGKGGLYETAKVYGKGGR